MKSKTMPVLEENKEAFFLFINFVYNLKVREGFLSIRQKPEDEYI